MEDSIVNLNNSSSSVCLEDRLLRFFFPKYSSIAGEIISEYTEYEDGTVDQPFLNHETLMEEEQDERRQ